MVSMITLKNREEWLAKRKSFIGGSDASCIIGCNPYKNNVELWEEKVGLRTPEDISEKEYVKYGTEAEEHLRALFALDYPQYEVKYAENNMWLNDSFPFGHASLDGWLLEKETGRMGVLEIKTTNIIQSIQKEKWNHRIPDNYYAQVLHYLAITGLDFVCLKCQMKYNYNGEIFLNTKHYFIEREEVVEDIAYLMKAEEIFNEFLKKGERPPLILPEI